MKYIANSTEIQYTINSDGIIEFTHDVVLYRSMCQATLVDTPNSDFPVYSAPLVCPEDAEYPDDIVGKIEWDSIDESCDDALDSFDWDKFVIYLY